MQNIGNLVDYELLGEGHDLVLPATKSKRVRIECNAGVPTKLFYAVNTGDRKLTMEDYNFLALVSGHEVVQFRCPLPLSIVSDQPVFINTRAGTEPKVREASESFSKIIERRAVSPDVAAVMQRANANQRSMLRQMEEMRNMMFSQMKAQNNATKPVNQSASVVGDDAETGKQKPDIKPVAPVEPQGEGSQVEENKTDES